MSQALPPQSPLHLGAHFPTTTTAMDEQSCALRPIRRPVAIGVPQTVTMLVQNFADTAVCSTGHGRSGRIHHCVASLDALPLPSCWITLFLSTPVPNSISALWQGNVFCHYSARPSPARDVCMLWADSCGPLTCCTMRTAFDSCQSVLNLSRYLNQFIHPCTTRC